MKPYWQHAPAAIYHGDCLEVLARMPEGSVDTVITDPPYLIGFMSKKWDKSGISFSPDTWRAVLRVLKPGGFLLAMGGTRTWHRLACAVEDAGFEVRDTMMWCYGQGFPKSHALGKAIDKKLGKKRKVVGTRPVTCGTGENFGKRVGTGHKGVMIDVIAPTSPEAALWHGWGTALKPAWEPILVAMKPLDGTFAENALKHGVAGLNVDGGRIAHGDETVEDDGERVSMGRETCHEGYDRPNATMFRTGKRKNRSGPFSPKGRWPANLILSHDPRCVLVGEGKAKTGKAVRHRGGGKTFGGDVDKPPMNDMTYADPDGMEATELWACVPGCPVRMMDEQSGWSKSPPIGSVARVKAHDGFEGKSFAMPDRVSPTGHGDFGGASRFFYCAKVSRRERHLGMPHKNTHPTVKPVDLMRYLCVLTSTPHGGVVLDPFCGSGSTGIAAMLTGRSFIGIDQDKESCEASKYRIRYAQKHLEQFTYGKPPKKPKTHPPKGMKQGKLW